MSEQNQIIEREEAIIRHLELAMTGYLGSRGPAKTVAHAFDLLSALREERVSWDHITTLFNQARQRHNQRHGLAASEMQTTSRTLCRLFNLQKVRLTLADAQPGRMHHPTPTLDALVGASPGDISAHAVEPNSANPDAPPAKPRTNQPRDGPPANSILARLQNNQDRKEKIKNIMKEDFND